MALRQTAKLAGQLLAVPLNLRPPAQQHDPTTSSDPLVRRPVGQDLPPPRRHVAPAACATRVLHGHRTPFLVKGDHIGESEEVAGDRPLPPLSEIADPPLRAQQPEGQLVGGQALPANSDHRCVVPVDATIRCRAVPHQSHRGTRLCTTSRSMAHAFVQPHAWHCSAMMANDRRASSWRRICLGMAMPAARLALACTASTPSRRWCAITGSRSSRCARSRPSASPASGNRPPASWSRRWQARPRCRAT